MPRSDRPPTTDRLRSEIDHGAAADKVAFPDPAAAPLGTDDEAGGNAPGPAAVAHAFRHEARRPDGALEQEPELNQGRRRLATILVSWGGLVTLAAIGLALTLI